MFDRVTIEVRAGAGGNGSASLRHEKFAPKGGPDGGDGGRGGSVYLRADSSHNTLLIYRYRRIHKASAGAAGRGKRQHGKAGKDLILPVPVGTVVYDANTNKLLADLASPGEQVVVAHGGRGGLGNTHFSTSSFQTPKFAELGEPGEETRVCLELKLIADVGLVGFPNAGKSTLLSVLSAATPKIGAYPFTTLEPVLGAVESPNSDQTFVVADIPGIIEGAHTGTGLGDEFLRHIERTRVIVFVVDGSGQEGREPADDLQVIRRELELYQADLAERPALIAFNKVDMPEAQQNLEVFRARAEVTGMDVMPISAAARQGLVELKRAIAHKLEDAPPIQRFAPEQNETVLHPKYEDSERYQIRRKGNRTWQIYGPTIERLAVMTNMENPDAVRRLEREMNRLGITSELEERGIQEGHVLRIGGVEIDWGPQ